MLSPTDRRNFLALTRAFAAGHVALLEVQSVSDDAVISAICSVSVDGEKFFLTPFASMIEGNPFELLRLPDPDGSGSFRTEEPT